MKRVPKMTIVLCLVVSLLVTFHLNVQVADASQLPHCGAWNIIPSPNPGTTFNDLYAVAAVSRNDVWTVGLSYSSNSTKWLTLIEHWNGTKWSTVSSPSPGTAFNSLYGLAAVSTNDIWAVGNYDSASASSFTFPLIEHWNGSAWKVVSSPYFGQISALGGIVAITANDIWAVGSYSLGPGSNNATLIEHWDGSRWSIVSSPNPRNAITSGLKGVSAISANNIWAVGGYVNNNGSETLVERWDGSRWSIIPSPSPQSSELDVVSQVPDTNQLWATGIPNGGLSIQTFTEHWNDKKWRTVSNPNPGKLSNNLNSVVALSTSNAWAVGVYNNQFGSGLTLTEHWNGSKWSLVPSPNSGQSSVLSAVAQVPGTNQLWSVGTFYNGRDQTLIEYYC